MRTIYFITRTLPDGNSGGALIRRGQINFLCERGYHVVIVAPGNKTQIGEDLILIKYNSNRMSFLYNVLLSYFRIKCDYLAGWAEDAIKVLSTIITKEDIVLATSGGEMGTLYLASLLKKKIGCKAILNLHDPIVHTLLEGEYSYKSRYPVPNRDASEKKLFKQVDAVITSSQYYCDYLKKKHNNICSRFYCHHFGYINEIETPQLELRDTDRLNVVYGGNMGHLQGPEILIEVAKKCPHIDFTLVGNVTFTIPQECENIKCLPVMKYETFVEYMIKHADIGFFSLKGNISKWCVPSKLYEYINVGLPVLAAIQGDAKDIIIANEFGCACNYEVESIVKSLTYMQQSNVVSSMKKNILTKRSDWYMGNTIAELQYVVENV